MEISVMQIDPTLSLPEPWYTEVIVEGAKIDEPGLYEWEIAGRGCYIGKYKKIPRPRKEYVRNLRRLIKHLPYRLSNADGYRKIHHELARAHRDGIAITLTILKNPKPDEINAREQELIAERGNLNGSYNAR
jgi:hypothetical protein